MRTTRTAVAITVMALVGLVVSVTAAWSQLTPDETVRQWLGPPATRSYDLTPDSAGGDGMGRRDRVSRSIAAPTPAGDPAPAVRPVKVSVSTVGIDAITRAVGVAPDGQMQLPPDPRVLGWYRYGPAPDGVTEGSAVVAGHLDSRRYGLGPLVRLRDVRTGDLVKVGLSDGSQLTYRVVALTRFDQQALPAQLFARTGPPRLHIITCGGEYDIDAGGYQQNLVVTAIPA